MLEFLNENAGALTVLFSGVVTIATVVYAVLTWKLVSETRRLREVQTEPEISISTLNRGESISWVDIRFQNIGLGPAYYVKFELIDDPTGAGAEWLSHRAFFSEGIRYLAPGDKIQFFLTSFAENHARKIQTRFSVKTSYKNALGKLYCHQYTIDLSEYRNRTRLGKPPVYQIASNVKKMQPALSVIATELQKLRELQEDRFKNS